MLFRNDSDRTGLCFKLSDMRGIITCCNLANSLYSIVAEDVVVQSVFYVALNPSFPKS